MSAANPQFMQYYGAWSNSTQYPFNTDEALTSGPVVSYNGGLYIAKAATTVGHAPSVYPAEWDALELGGGALYSYCNGIFSAGSPLGLTSTPAIIPSASFTITKSTDITVSGNNIVLPQGYVYNCILSCQADSFTAIADNAKAYFVNTTASVNSNNASSVGVKASTGIGSQGFTFYQLSTAAAAVTLNIAAVVNSAANITSGNQFWFQIYST